MFEFHLLDLDGVALPGRVHKPLHEVPLVDLARVPLLENVLALLFVGLGFLVEGHRDGALVQDGGLARVLSLDVLVVSLEH